MKFLESKIFGVDKCEVVESAPMAELGVASARIQEVDINGEAVNYVVMTLVGGGQVSATPKGDLKDLQAGEEVPVATATVELVRNRETGHQSYRAR